MNVTIRFNLWRVIALLFVFLNLAAFGHHVWEGDWRAFFSLTAATALLAYWSDEVRDAGGGKPS